MEEVWVANVQPNRRHLIFSSIFRNLLPFIQKQFVCAKNIICVVGLVLLPFLLNETVYLTFQGPWNYYQAFPFAPESAWPVPRTTLENTCHAIILQETDPIIYGVLLSHLGWSWRSIKSVRARGWRLVFQLTAPSPQMKRCDSIHSRK